MPYTLDSAAEAALAAGRMVSALLMDLYCKDGDGDPLTLRFWNWPGTLDYPANDHVDDDDPVTYQSLLRRVSVDVGVRFTATLTAEPMTINFDSSRAGDDADLIGQFADANWHQGRVRARRVLLDFSTQESPSDPVWEWRGRMDHRVFQRQAQDEQTCVLTCEGGVFRVRGRNMHTRTHLDQQRRLAGDLFFQGTAIMVGLPAMWAKAPANIPGVKNPPAPGGPPADVLNATRILW